MEELRYSQPSQQTCPWIRPPTCRRLQLRCGIIGNLSLMMSTVARNTRLSLTSSSPLFFYVFIYRAAARIKLAPGPGCLGPRRGFTRRTEEAIDGFSTITRLFFFFLFSRELRTRSDISISGAIVVARCAWALIKVVHSSITAANVTYLFLG